MKSLTSDLDGLDIVYGCVGLLFNYAFSTRREIIANEKGDMVNNVVAIKITKTDSLLERFRFEWIKNTDLKSLDYKRFISY